MKRAEVLQGVREMRFIDVLGRHESGDLSQAQAAELLGIGERTFRRWCRRFEEEGEAGLLDRRLGKPSPKRVPQREAEEVERLYRERYAGFTAKHFHEFLVREHNFNWGYSWTKVFLQGRDCARTPAWGAPAQAAAPTDGRDDAAPGWLDPSLDPGTGS